MHDLQVLRDDCSMFLKVPEGTSNIKISVPIAVLAEEGEDLAQAAKMAIDFSAAAPAAQPTAPVEGPPANPAANQPQVDRWVKKIGWFICIFMHIYPSITRKRSKRYNELA